MEFNRPVSRVLVSKVSASGSAAIAASEAVISRQECARHTLTIVNSGSGTVYIGDKDVSSDNGIPLANGEKITIPVVTTTYDQVYVVGGDVTIAEWF